MLPGRLDRMTATVDAGRCMADRRVLAGRGAAVATAPGALPVRVMTAAGDSGECMQEGGRTWRC